MTTKTKRLYEVEVTYRSEKYITEYVHVEAEDAADAAYLAASQYPLYVDLEIDSIEEIING